MSLTAVLSLSLVLFIPAIGTVEDDCLSREELAEEIATVKAETRERIDRLNSQLFNWQNGALDILKQHCSSTNTQGCAGGDCVEGDLRLVGGSDLREGIVEICYQGRYVTVCPDDWSDREAEVVCRQLNNQTSNAKAVDGKEFGQSSSPPLYHVTCDSTEAKLSACNSEIHQCDSIESAAAVICQDLSVENSNLLSMIVVPAAAALFLILVLLTLIVCCIIVVVIKKRNKRKRKYDTAINTLEGDDVSVYKNEVYGVNQLQKEL